ncbi:conserved hypothetical protein [Synechococcus sp. WH 8103]|nr:hypothetical protein SynRS9915_01642 [Synechococcus sp. RS9915]QNJ17091.1 hypothetical protein SynA1840_01552 [Synechococcus sp. A18-40]CRY92339.1 conserved hypothetical protein [Synechococcus sp. WH 8103]
MPQVQLMAVPTDHNELRHHRSPGTYLFQQSDFNLQISPGRTPP